MHALPVIARELRAEARHPFTYGLRLIGAVALMLGAVLVLDVRASAAQQGASLFAWMHGILLAAMVIFGIGRGGYDCNIMPVLCEIAPPELRATGYGLFNCAGTVAGGVVAALAGALKSSIGLGGMLQAAGLLFFVAAILLFRLEIPGYKQRALDQ